jgi:hypothetical protein
MNEAETVGSFGRTSSSRLFDAVAPPAPVAVTVHTTRPTLPAPITKALLEDATGSEPLDAIGAAHEYVSDTASVVVVFRYAVSPTRTSDEPHSAVNTGMSSRTVIDAVAVVFSPVTACFDTKVHTVVPTSEPMAVYEMVLVPTGNAPEPTFGPTHDQVSEDMPMAAVFRSYACPTFTLDGTNATLSDAAGVVTVIVTVLFATAPLDDVALYMQVVVPTDAASVTIDVDVAVNGLVPDALSLPAVTREPEHVYSNETASVVDVSSVIVSPTITESGVAVAVNNGFTPVIVIATVVVAEKPLPSALNTHDAIPAVAGAVKLTTAVPTANVPVLPMTPEHV